MKLEKGKIRDVVIHSSNGIDIISVLIECQDHYVKIDLPPFKDFDQAFQTYRHIKEMD